MRNFKTMYAKIRENIRIHYLSLIFQNLQFWSHMRSLHSEANAKYRPEQWKMSRGLKRSVFNSIFTRYFLLYIKSIGFVKIFDMQFTVDLHVLLCPKHVLTTFRKCACLKYCGHCTSIINAQKQTIFGSILI